MRQRGTSMSEINRRVTYPFPLRPGVICELRLPVDLTQTEARRLAEWVETLVRTPSHS
jgi:hypothetical protein